MAVTEWVLKENKDHQSEWFLVNENGPLVKVTKENDGYKALHLLSKETIEYSSLRMVAYKVHHKLGLPYKPRLSAPKLSDEQLKQFVLDFCDGALYTSAHPSKMEDIKLVFLPLMLGALSDWIPEELETIGLIYEDMSKAMPRSVNGMPMFMSCHIMHIEDWERARKAIDAEFDRRKSIEV